MHPLAGRPVNPDLLSRTGGSVGFAGGCRDSSWVSVDGSIKRQPAGVNRFAGQTEAQDSRP
jgi:hypothetical protein